MVSWSTLQSALLLFGPYIYSKTKAFYRSTRVRTAPVPLPSSTKHTLNVLFICAVCFLISTLPYFASENIFMATKSRLQTPTDVLFHRLSKHRDALPTDEALRSRLQSKEARLLYAAYGPRPLQECNWCSVDDPNTFLWYALPGLVLPHLVHIFVLGLVTSGVVSRSGKLWRAQATIAGLALLAAELYFVGISSADYRKNSRARGDKEIVWTHWRMQMFRGVAVATLDAVLGYAVFLTGTRRWSIGWEQQAVDETIEGISKTLEKTAGRLQAATYIKQAVMRNSELRGKATEFWTKEEALGREINEDEEVVKVKMGSLPGRVDMDQLHKEATTRSMGLLTMVVKDHMHSE